MRPKVAIGLTLLVAAATLSTLAGAAVSPVPTSLVHAAVTTAAGTDVSSNWAGYVATGPGSTSTTASTSMAFTDVTGQWTQPRAVCTRGRDTSSALWVGLGGYSLNSQKLEQTGTEADCDRNGNATYYAWYELLPADPVNLKLKIDAGDVIASTVVIHGNHVLVQVTDRTRNTRFTKRLTIEAPDLTSAEWIAEAPSECEPDGSKCRTLPLTNFGSVAFTRTYTIGNKLPGTITTPNWMWTQIQLIPDATAPNRFFGHNVQHADPMAAGATPTGLTGDGSGFTVTWQAHPAAATP